MVALKAVSVMESIFPFLLRLKLDVHIARALQMEKAHNLEDKISERQYFTGNHFKIPAGDKS